MHSAAPFLILLSSALLVCGTSAIPTWSDSNSLSRGLSAVGPTVQSQNKRDYESDGGNADNDEMMPNYFPIPGTLTSVRLGLNGRGPSSAERKVLNATSNFITEQLAASGDGQLPQSVDPFTFDTQDGCYFNASSVEGQHLTWGILGDTVNWLYKHMGERAQYREGATLWIFDSNVDCVGIGLIVFDYTDHPNPQVVQGPAGVTNYSA